MRPPLILIGSLMAAPAAAQDTYSSLNAPVTMADVSSAMPVPASSAPPAVADAGTTGNMTNVYALANHTHASKARRGRVLVPTSGMFPVTFSSPFSTAPLCAVTAETTAGDTNVVNAQIDGVTTTTSMTIRITRTQISVASLLGLSILSIAAPVATYAHYICIEP